MKKIKLFMPIYIFTVLLTFSSCKINPEIVANDMPIIEIHTENKVSILSKKEYVNAEITLKNTDDVKEFSNISAGIRGRGNYTWKLDKKPYRIKFDQKNNMFQDYAAKSWTLIANHTDKSLLKNYLALYLANSLDGMNWNSTATFVEVYLNSVYQGVYLLCDQIQVDKNRINVETESTNVDTGFLIERDRYIEDDDEAEEGVDYFYIDQTPYAVKTPEKTDKNFSTAKIDFIKNYMQEVNDAIIAKKFAKVQELCDINSIIDFYIVGQIMASNEFNGGSSFFMHKNAGQKLQFGPVWDFDLSLGYRTESLSVAYKNEDYTTLLSDNQWFNKLYEMEDFRNMFINRINNIHSNLDDLITEMDRVQQKYNVAFNNNFLCWNIKEDLWLEPKAVKKFKSQNDYYLYTRDFLQKRVDYFKDNKFII